MNEMIDEALLAARAMVLHDLNMAGQDAPACVDVLDAVVAERRWWVEQWPDGAPFVAGQITQDVQERMLDAGLGRWPLCRSCDDTEVHELNVAPELGTDPQWVCERAGIEVAVVGELR